MGTISSSRFKPLYPQDLKAQRFYGLIYKGFQQRAPDAMTACYHSSIVFSDPVFQTLNGEKAVAMWHMLLGRSKDIEVSFSDIQADDQTGSAHWEAHYTYSASARKVHNVVTAQFRFQGGKILVHHDTFDLAKWAAQALGISGSLFGWTPLMQRAIRRNAAQALNTFMAKKTSEP